MDIADSEGELIAVAGSIQEGDRVAIRGAQNLSNGAEVRIVMPEAASIEVASEAGQAGYPTCLVPADGLATARVAGICPGALHSLEVPATVTGILLPLRLSHADTFAKS